ncbi:MAG: DUF1049 domain-containing protein [Anaeromyxobacter sp.]
MTEAVRRWAVAAVLLALAAGATAAWWLRRAAGPSPEDRAREAAQTIRERVNELAH